MKWQDVVRELNEKEKHIKYLEGEQERLEATLKAIEEELEKFEPDSPVSLKGAEDFLEVLKTTEVAEIIEVAERYGFQSYIQGFFEARKEEGNLYSVGPLRFKREVALDAVKEIVSKSRAERTPVGHLENAIAIISNYHIDETVKCYDEFSCSFNLNSKGKIVEWMRVDEEEEGKIYTQLMELSEPYLILKWPDEKYTEHYRIGGKRMPTLDIHIQDFPEKLDHLFSSFAKIIEEARKGEGYVFEIWTGFYIDGGKETEFIMVPPLKL